MSVEVKVKAWASTKETKKAQKPYIHSIAGGEGTKREF